jgi:hypothetical protein
MRDADLRNRRAVSLSGLLILLLSPLATGQTPGPGIPAITYPSNQLFTVISRLNGSNGAPRGHGFASMVNGYLFVIFSNDSGGGNGSGGFAFYSLANPYAPVNIFTTYNNPAYTSGPNNPGELREGHAYSFSGNYACIPTRRGLTFWDFTNVGPPLNAPQKLYEIGSLTRRQPLSSGIRQPWGGKTQPHSHQPDRRLHRRHHLRHRQHAGHYGE